MTIDSLDKFCETELPSKDAFYNRLKMSKYQMKITDMHVRFGKCST